MRITQWGEYGVLCSIYIAQRIKDGQTSINAADIAAAQNIAVDYAQQILQRLRRAAIIESVRGPTGGYKLTKCPADITLKDILVASEGDTFEVICETKPINTERCATGSECALRPIWFKLKEHINNFLVGYTLQSLLDAPHLGNCVSEAAQTVQIGEHGADANSH